MRLIFNKIYIIYLLYLYKKMDKLYRKKILCNYLTNKDLLNIDIENSNIKSISFTKDNSKDLLYSKVLLYNGIEVDFIYKLSSEIQKCQELYKN